MKAESQQSILIESVKGGSRILPGVVADFSGDYESRILRGFLRGKGEPWEVRLFDGVGSLSGGFACGDLVAGRGMDLERTDNRFALE